MENDEGLGVPHQQLMDGARVPRRRRSFGVVVALAGLLVTGLAISSQADGPGRSDATDGLDPEIRAVIAEAEQAFQAAGARSLLDSNGKANGQLAVDRSREVRPALDAGGKTVIAAAERTDILRTATTALSRVFASPLVTEYMGAVTNAVSAQTGSDFAFAGGGADIVSIDESEVKALTATVTATVRIWSKHGNVLPDGSVEWLNPQNDIIVKTKLTKVPATGRWIVAQRTWDFVGGAP